jgi:hypothetical protein
MHNKSRLIVRSLRPAWLWALALAVGVALAQPAAAFTIEGGDARWSPKFDLEEQARQFRAPGREATPGTTSLDVPGGRLQFGVQRDTPAFGSPFDMPSRAQRHHYDRLFDPSYQFNGR